MISQAVSPFAAPKAPTNGRVGQTSDDQIDCLADLGHALGDHGGRLWCVRNGYALPTRDGLREINSRLAESTEALREELRSTVRIGTHWDTQVTLDGATHNVSQAYCSDLPVAYGEWRTQDWEPFARLILESAYEATMCAAVVNAARTGCTTVFLTLLGGGAFGNPTSWIVDALERALCRATDSGLTVYIVSHRKPNPSVRELVAKLA
jgi:hypothetical protein